MARKRSKTTTCCIVAAPPVIRSVDRQVMELRQIVAGLKTRRSDLKVVVQELEQSLRATKRERAGLAKELKAYSGALKDARRAAAMACPQQVAAAQLGVRQIAHSLRARPRAPRRHVPGNLGR